MEKCGLAICTPMPIVPGKFGPRLEPITVEWQRARHSLGLPTNCNWVGIVADGMEVGVARNHAVNVAMAHDPLPEFLFFLDYDVLPLYDAVMKLVYRARCYPEHDIIAGVYCCKSEVPEPLIYDGDGAGGYWDWTVGDLLLDKITGCHMGLTLIRTSLFERMEYSEDLPLFSTTPPTVVREPGKPNLKMKRGTEDLFFCRRAREEAGAKILVDTSVLAGHVDNKTGRVYGLPKDCLPFKRAKWAQRLKTDPDAKENDVKQPKLKALDIGAGGTRREWDGYETETTDIRSDTKPDYVMDTRWLNLPDASFDMVCSSHHLEHIGRYEQEKVWTEMFRILKPGGRMEHTVPNLEWAAWKIADGDVDAHTYNVLYGAQESQGYARDMNTHYFGYTPAIAKALAEQAGFIDVETKDYKAEPDLGYNLVITGRKAEVKEVSEDKELAVDVSVDTTANDTFEDRPKVVSGSWPPADYFPKLTKEEVAIGVRQTNMRTTPEEPKDMPGNTMEYHDGSEDGNAAD